LTFYFQTKSDKYQENLGVLIFSGLGLFRATCDLRMDLACDDKCPLLVSMTVAGIKKVIHTRGVDHLEMQGLLMIDLQFAREPQALPKHTAQGVETITMRFVSP
jgi:hypothetical protein